MPGVLPRGGLAAGWSLTPVAEFRERVTIIGTVQTDDGHGGWIETEVTLLDHVLASVLMLTGRDLQYAQQVEPRSTWRVCIRYDKRVRSEHEVTYHDTERGDRRFEIVSPPLDIGERHWELQLLCREAETAATT